MHISLRELLDWMRHGDGTYWAYWHVRKWNLQAQRKAKTRAVDEVSDHAAKMGREIGGDWQGGPCEPIGIFEDSGALLESLGIAPGEAPGRN